jgi:hypothetical protein
LKRRDAVGNQASYDIPFQQGDIKKAKHPDTPHLPIISLPVIHGPP